MKNVNLRKSNVCFLVSRIVMRKSDRAVGLLRKMKGASESARWGPERAMEPEYTRGI